MYYDFVRNRRSFSAFVLCLTYWISFYECTPMYTVSSPDDIPFDSKPVRAYKLGSQFLKPGAKALGSRKQCLVFNKFWFNPPAIFLDQLDQRISSFLHGNTSLHHLLQKQVKYSSVKLVAHNDVQSRHSNEDEHGRRLHSVGGSLHCNQCETHVSSQARERQTLPT